MINVRDAAKSFGRRNLWRALNLSIDAGDMVALVGPSGSGKSTLLNCIGLLEKLDHGSISIDGRSVSDCSGRDARKFRRDHLGYLFQNYALIDAATVQQNLDVVLPPRPRIFSRQIRVDRAEALRQVGLGGSERDKIYSMSGGEQQRVALARLIVKQPSIILADEPTGALDAGNAEMVMSTLRGFADRGATIVLATHSHEVISACDRVVDVNSFAPADEERSQRSTYEAVAHGLAGRASRNRR